MAVIIVSTTLNRHKLCFRLLIHWLLLRNGEGLYLEDGYLHLLGFR